MFKGKLLLIDDDQDFIDTMAYELEQLGLTLFTATNLQEAQSLTETIEEIDYAIIDLRVGTDSGLDIIPLIRQSYPKAKITMLTAFGSIATTVEAIKRGCDNYIMKPCSKEEILAALALGKDKSNPKVCEEVPDLYRKEREYIDFVLQMKNGNISHAAEALGIKRQSLQRKLKKFIPKP